MLTHRDPHSTDANQLWSVHSQRGNGRSAGRCERDDFRSVFIPFKVVRPVISLRMKERNLIAGGWVGRRLAIGLKAIARRTSQTSVVENRRSACGTGHDVLDFKNRHA